MEQKFQSLQSKIEKLIHLHKKAIDDNLKLKAVLESFQQQLNDQHLQIEVLKNEKIELISSVSDPIISNSETVMVKKSEFDEILKDIDKCIKVLRSN